MSLKRLLSRAIGLAMVSQPVVASGCACEFDYPEYRNGRMTVPVQIAPGAERGSLGPASAVAVRAGCNAGTGAISFVTDLEWHRTHLLTIAASDTALFTTHPAILTGGGMVSASTYIGTYKELP